MTQILPALTTAVTYPVNYDTTFFAPFAFYKADWGQGVSVSSEYKIAITEFANANEQRIIYTSVPYRKFSSTLFSETRSERRQLESLCNRLTMARCLLPIYADELLVEGPVSAGDTTLSCNPLLSRASINSKVMVVNPVTEAFEIRTVVAMSDTELTLSSGLSSVYAEGCLVFPLYLSEVTEKLSAVCKSPIVCDVTVKTDEALGEYTLDPSADITTAIPVFEFPSDWSSSVTLGYKRTLEMRGEGPTQIPMLNGQTPSRTVELSLVCMSREEAFDIINLFDSVRGSLKPFYFDLLDFPIEVVSFTSSSVTIVDDTGLGEFRVGDFITQIAWNGARMQRAIASIVPILGGFILNMAGGPWLSDASLVDCFVPTILARFYKPTLEEKWITPSIMKTNLSVVEVQDNETLSMDLSELVP